jgi:hypothetical protein
MDVAVVYAPEDASRIREIAEALGRAGLKCEVDRTVPPGQTYEIMAAERLERARAVLVAWSPSLIAAPALIDEAAQARDRGKAFGVLLAPAAAPAGFAELPFSDLSAWPAPTAKHALKRLADDLKRRKEDFASAAEAVRQMGGHPRFMRTAKFWLFSLALALALGGLLYISPEGQEGRGFGIAGRANNLVMSIVYGFVFISLARALLHLSGRLVGRESAAYFSREFLKFGLVVGVLAVLMGISGAAPQAQPGLPPSSFTYSFASAIVVLAPLAALGVAMFRAMRRLLFGRA